MSAWTEQTLDVIHDLHLDPQNVRLDTPSESPEADIIQDLFQNEKAFDLVEGIVEVGYFTHERPIVVERGGTMVVVEGNRRVAALKAIQNPYLVPAFQSKIVNLVKRLPTRETLRQIVVIVAPSQDEANQLIAALHTGRQRVAWSRVRQAAFFDAQLKANASLDDLVARYPTIDVRAFARRSSILKLFRSVDYEDSELAKYIRRSDFPLTVLERLYGNITFQEIAGISVSPATTRASVADEDQFAVLAEKVIGDIHYKRVNTRRLNAAKSAEFAQYLEELRTLTLTNDDDGSEKDAAEPADSSRADRPPAETQSAQDANASSSNETGANAAADAALRLTPVSRQGGQYLNTDGLIPWAQFPELGRVFTEVGRIPYKNYPNATHDLLRSVLEKSIKAYAEVRNVAIPSGGRYVQLSACVNWLVQEFDGRPECQPLRPHAKLLKDGVTGSYYLYQASQDYMNAINHNFRSCATPDHVESAWTAMRPVIGFMFKDVP
jgi:hypothetical protein